MITVIILTYNSEKYIKKLLDSLIEKYITQIKEEKIEILVADNASQDETIQMVKAYKGLVSVLDNEANLGFAKGNNAASKKAKGEYLLFINPDAEFDKGDIESLMQNLEHDHVGVVGGRILTFNGNKELSCGKFYTFFNIFLLCLGLEEKLGVRFSPHKSTDVDYVSGGFMGISKKVFSENRGFDEHYFMYVEDQDLCYRLRKKGLMTYFSDAATIKHIGQGSSNRAFAIINIYKGLSYFQKKHMSKFSYTTSIFLLSFKAQALRMLGILTRNKYLSETYGQASKVI